MIYCLENKFIIKRKLTTEVFPDSFVEVKESVFKYDEK